MCEQVNLILQQRLHQTSAPRVCNCIPVGGLVPARHAPPIQSCLASVPVGLSLGGLALSPAALLSWGSVSRTLGWTFPCCFPAERDAPAWGRGPAGGVGWVLCWLGWDCMASASLQVPCTLMVLNKLSGKEVVTGIGIPIPLPGAFLAKGILCSSSGAWSRRCNSKQSLQRSCSCPLSLPCRC